MCAKANTERGFENGTGKPERHQAGNRSNAGDPRKAGRNLPRSARQELKRRAAMIKSWNVRDQTKEALEELLRRKYKEIDGNYKMLKKISDINDAKKLLEEIWQMKGFADAIELELIRREYSDGTTS